MNKCLKFALIFSAVGASMALCAGPAAASSWSISATTIGTQSVLSYTGVTANPASTFYSVNMYGAPAVKSITYDLSGGGYFDFNTADFGSSAPLLDSGNSSNFRSFGSGVTWSASGPNSACTSCYNTLTFNFADTSTFSFAGSDSFSFGAATFQVNGDGAFNGINGSDFGNAAVPFTVNFWDGSSAGANFYVNQDLGGSEADVLPSAVPLPAAAWLFGSGLIALAGSARRRKRG